jgi:hypothetical protein
MERAKARPRDKMLFQAREALPSKDKCRLEGQSETDSRSKSVRAPFVRLPAVSKQSFGRNLEDGRSAAALWLEKTVGEQVGKSDEGFPAGGGVGEAVVESGVED